MSLYDTPPHDQLYQQHVVDKMSRRDLERYYGVTAPVIDRWFRQLGIAFIGRKDRTRPLREELIELHVNQRKTLQEISTIYNRAQRYVDQWFEHYGIDIIRYRKRRKLVVSRDVLISMHHSNEMSLAEIAERLGVSDVMVGKWFDTFGIEKKQFYKQSSTSKAEIQIADYIKTLGVIPIKTRSVLPNRLELDLYMQQHSFAVEHCGLYWHNEHRLPPSYHAMKTKLAKMQGIQLFTLFEDEWIERRSVLESMIAHKLKGTPNKIYARRCTVGVIDNKQAKRFFETTHIQGAPGTIKLAVGLYYESELVGCMSFGKHHRSNTGVILQRLSFKLNTSVVGGASKLFKYAQQQPFCVGSDIITWSDERYATGNVYKQLGFTESDAVPADYFYVKGQRRYPKQRFQKRFTGCPVDITEKQHAESNGFTRIWDCGKIKWVKRSTNVNMPNNEGI